MQIYLKGQCHKIIFFFSLKDSTWAPYEQAKTVSRNFFIFREDIWLQSSKIACPRSRWGFHIFKLLLFFTWLFLWKVRSLQSFLKVFAYCSPCRVRVINDYADTVSAWSTTTPTPCRCGQRLCWHCVHIVNNYANIVSA